MNNEPCELSRLLKAIQQQLDSDDLDTYYKIILGDTTVTLVCGGPQLEGLYCLVDQIAAENLYTVDYENNLVTE